MPAEVVKVKGGYSVKTPSGVHARKTTKAKAEAQKRLLNYVDYLKSRHKKLPKQ